MTVPVDFRIEAERARRIAAQAYDARVASELVSYARDLERKVAEIELLGEQSSFPAPPVSPTPA